jgi:hypothetical protein
MTYNISKRDLIINTERYFTKKIAGPDFFLRARGRRSIVAQRKKRDSPVNLAHCHPTLYTDFTAVA